MEMIGADKEELSSHCNYVLQQAVCKVLKKVRIFSNMHLFELFKSSLFAL